MTDSRSLSEALDPFRFAMFVTHDGRGLGARPLTVQEVEGDVVRFLVSAQADWYDAVAARPQVLLSFADPTGNSYASVSGTATGTADRALVERLYNPVADAFFEGVDDPQLRVLEVTATDGEWWDGPSGRIGQAIGILRTKLSGDHDAAGEQGDIAVEA